MTRCEDSTLFKNLQALKQCERRLINGHDSCDRSAAIGYEPLCTVLYIVQHLAQPGPCLSDADLAQLSHPVT